jgi:molybdate transport system substrate-binding protein
VLETALLPMSERRRNGFGYHLIALSKKGSAIFCPFFHRYTSLNWRIELKALLKTLTWSWVIFLIIIGGISGCGQTSLSSQSPSGNPQKANSTVAAKEIMVFSGSASKPPLDEAAQVFEKNTGVKVYLTYGGSGSVLSQMKLSKTGDVYIPGSPDYLVKSNRDSVTESDSSKIISYLIPVMAVQHGNPKGIQSLSDVAKPGIKVGIGNPKAVCVGLYAIEILDYNHLLTEVNKNIVTNADSCEATASLITLKAVDAVIGWDVFHYWVPDKIDIIYLKPEQLPRIAYIPAAVSTYTKDKESSKLFIDFLASKSSQDIFKKWGYITTEFEAKTFSPNASIGGEYVLPPNY